MTEPQGKKESKSMCDLASIAAASKRVADINPNSIDAYPDCVRLWLPKPLLASDLDWLDAQCGDDMYAKTYPKRWQRESYQQFLSLPQPTPAALQFLSEYSDGLLNYAEIALDWTFDDAELNAHAADTANNYIVKRWHRDSQGIRFVAGVTRYTGPRTATTNLVSYNDEPSRITGEIYCTHTEFRLRGVLALRRAGIHAVKDLLNLDYREFWRPRLILRAVDPIKLGRMYRVHIEGKDRRRGAYEDDGRVGGRIVHMLGSTQAVIDNYRNRFNVSRCLVDLDVEHLLPGGTWTAMENRVLQRVRSGGVQAVG
jgi:hypothetical protein